MRSLRLVSKRISGPIRCACGGEWYTWNTIGDVVAVPDQLAAMLLTPGYPFATFAEVTP